MSPVWHPAEQGSGSWLKARCGCLTASRMAEAMDFLKTGKEGEKRRKLKIELLAERMTDCMVERYVTSAMQWGIENEPAARERFEEETGLIVVQCGFALHDSIEYFGASPDGLVGHDSLLEIKCPSTNTHLQWMLDGVVPEQHKPQMLAQMAVTGATSCHFVSFDPRFPQQKQLFHRLFTPTAEEITAIEDAARLFLSECESMWDVLVAA